MYTVSSTVWVGGFEAKSSPSEHHWRDDAPVFDAADIRPVAPGRCVALVSARQDRGGRVRIERLKSIAATMAGGAIIASVAIVVNGGPLVSETVAGGSGDSSTTTAYTQPSVKPMSLPSTTTAAATKTNDLAPMSLATAKAAPTYKATAAAGCVNNGQCP
jgi:hypothetical protein